MTPWLVVVVAVAGGALALLALVLLGNRAIRRRSPVRAAATPPPVPADAAPARSRTSVLAPRRTQVVTPYLGPEGVAGWLVSLDGASPHMTWVCNRSGDTVIGADPGCGIIINDRMASGTHAVIAGRSGYFKLIDTDSTNGVYVDGKRIAGEQMLASGMRIRIGQTTYVWLTSEHRTGGAS